MKKQFLVYMFLLATSVASAQLYEIGLFAGGSNYIGDIGRTNYIYPNFPAAGGIAKFNFTPRINFRGTLIWSDLTATDLKANTQFRRNRGFSMKNRILDASGGIEFNFFKYSMNKVGFSQTPYIIAQGTVSNYRVFFYKGSEIYQKRKFAVMPSFGLGYKFRIKENFAASFETSFRYTMKDDIDEMSIRNISVGNTNSDDWYVFTGFTLTYGFGRPGCYKGNF